MNKLGCLWLGTVWLMACAPVENDNTDPATTANTGTTSITITKPTGIQINDVMIAVIVENDNSSNADLGGANGCRDILRSRALLEFSTRLADVGKRCL